MFSTVKLLYLLSCVSNPCVNKMNETLAGFHPITYSFLTCDFKSIWQTYYQLVYFFQIFIYILTTMGLTSVKVPKYLASDWFQKFDLIIFGDGIWENTHGGHLKNKKYYKRFDHSW